MKTITQTTAPSQIAKSVLTPRNRRGNILVLAAGALVMILGFTAFAVDIGYISLTRAQLQNAADAAALASAFELAAGNNPSQTTSSQTETAARQAAVDVAAANAAGGVSAVYLNSATDVEFGQRTWNSATNSWQDTWGVAPYNLVKVTAHRDRSSTSSNPTGDQPLNLFFAPALGQTTASLSVSSTAALVTAAGFRIAAASNATASALPIAFDLPSWDALLAGTGSDNFKYDPVTKTVSSGSDGIKEIDLYPYGNQDLTSGNRGTVDLGNPNNSTADLCRQIENGVNATDLSYFGGVIRTDLGPLYLNGDTGISAGIKSSLELIKGKPRAIPIFTAVSGPGNNATFTVVKFVGIRIMDVQLTGGEKRVIAQPATVIDASFFSSQTAGSTNQYIYQSPHLVH